MPQTTISKKIKPLISAKGLHTGAGVYLLKNSVTGETYVGASKSVRRRVQDHSSSIRAGGAPQRLVSAFGSPHEGHVIATLLQACTIDDLAACEFRWIREINPTCNTSILEGVGRPGIPTAEKVTERSDHAINNPTHLWAVYADDADARVRVWAEDAQDAAEQGAAIFGCPFSYVITRYVKTVSH